MTPVCQPSDHVPGQDASARELCSCSHQFIKGVLALVADDGRVMKIDDELASLKPLGSAVPGSL